MHQSCSIFYSRGKTTQSGNFNHNANRQKANLFPYLTLTQNIYIISHETKPSARTFLNECPEEEKQDRPIQITGCILSP